MSDGPHRSLPLKPKWRSVAERAFTPAFGIDEICNVMVPALAMDCHDEVTPRLIDALRRICEQRQNLLFNDDAETQLEALRQEAGGGMGRHVLENVVRVSKRGELNFVTLANAFERAFVDRLAKASRQIEEHTLRKSTAPRTNELRDRLEQATANAKPQLAALARNFLKLDNSRPVRSTRKRAGLDEGPKIK